MSKHLYTIDALIEERGEKTPESVAFYRETPHGYKPITARQFCIEKRALATALIDLGIKPGDTIGILSSVRYEWELAEKAAISIGCSSFGIDIRHSVTEIEVEIEAASIDVLVVENETSLTQIPPSFTADTIVIDSVHKEQPQRNIYNLEDLVKAHIGQKPCYGGDRDDWAVIISTSGTTGKPKLIRYRNHQIVAACLAISEMLELQDSHNESKSVICWLPLVYMTSKIMNLVDFTAGGSTYFLKNPKRIMDTIQEIQPTHFLSVPIFYERIYKGFIDKQQSLPFFKRHSIAAILWLRMHTPFNIAPGTIRAIREQLVGKRLEFALSGSSAISKEVLAFFKALAIDIYEAYALSENAIPMSMNTPASHRPGSVGKPSWRNTITFAPDGEIRVKGEGVFEGYLGDQSENADSFDSHGFLKTGDLGTFDADGFLYITGRKKSIIKTANGYRISPAEVEAVYEAIPYIKQILVVGDREKYIGALIVLDIDAVRTYLQQQSIPIPSVADIPKMKEVQELLTTECFNRRNLLAIYKQIKVFTLLAAPFTIEKGELTENFKLKRDVIIRRYQKEITDMFKNIQ